MNKPITYLSVDDNYLDLMAIQEYSKKHQNIQNIGSYANASDAILAVKDSKPNLIFLDVEMPEFSGIELLANIRELVPMAVFITSHAEFALEGFELSALDYILKPLTQERFDTCIKKVQEYWQMKNKAELYEIAYEKDSLTIKDGHNRLNIRKSDIIFAEAMQDYTKIVTQSKNYLTLCTLSDFVSQFPYNELIRVHRSYAVSTKKITEKRANELFCGNYLIPIGKTYKSFLAQI
jgi:DNA-binding LytR/AlgR family response regulator